MFKLYKPLMIASIILWISFIFHIIGLEIIGLTLDGLLISGITTIILLTLIYVYFIYFYIKNRKKVNDLKRQYLESLKPDKPIRFCPTDDELLAKYKEQEKSRVYKIQQNSLKQDTIETTNEDDEEMENF